MHAWGLIVGARWQAATEVRGQGEIRHSDVECRKWVGAGGGAWK